MPKAEVKRQMLAEQGYLCAYTMQRIETPDDCHIEHIVPRNQPNQPRHMDVDYNNLLACVPSNTPGHRPLVNNLPYGAPKKGGTHVDGANFVSPLRVDVESRFQYSVDGSVAHLPDDVSARSTVEILRLDHEQLKDLRRAAIDERVFPAEVTLSVQEAEHLSRAALTPDLAGRLPEFCLAISQVAHWYAARMQETI
jgi:uncharacterized protein (TIGR02646 family)